MYNSPDRQPEYGYDRTLIDDLQHIKSVCVDCGTVIVGSASSGLENTEEKHKLECKKHETSLIFLSAPSSQHAS